MRLLMTNFSRGCSEINHVRMCRYSERRMNNHTISLKTGYIYIIYIYGNYRFHLSTKYLSGNILFIHPAKLRRAYMEKIKKGEHS